MKTRGDRKRMGSRTGMALLAGLLIAGLVPAAALAQWTHSGNATIGGKLGVGTQNPARGIHLSDHNAVFRMDRDRDSAAFMIVRTAPGDFNTLWKSYTVGVRADGVNDGYFHISDLGDAVTGEGARRLTLANDGRAGFGNVGDDPLAGLHVRNTVAGDIFRLDNVAGTEVFEVQDDGDLYAMGSDLELRLTAATSGGYNLGRTSTVLANTTGGTGDEAFLALNSATAVICSQGSDGRGLLQIQDSYNNWTNFQFNNDSIAMAHIGDIAIFASKQGEDQELILSTTGEAIQFVADSDADTAQNIPFSWYNNGLTQTNKLMELYVEPLAANHRLRIKGILAPSYAFDLAETYWKSDEAITAGDVVCIDPDQPNAVVLARAAGDPAVVGVVSTAPGIILGDSVFAAVDLEEVWGEEIAIRFAAERKGMEKNLAAADSDIKGRIARLNQKKSALAKSTGKPEEIARAKAEYDDDSQELADAKESAALQVFFRDHFVRLSLAGRVPVKVDASFGAIRIGDALVASSTPGHAMRSDNPAPLTVIGKALENFDSGRGTIMMMVLNR